jgi:hypothetical protein
MKRRDQHIARKTERQTCRNADEQTDRLIFRLIESDRKKERHNIDVQQRIENENAKSIELIMKKKKNMI